MQYCKDIYSHGLYGLPIKICNVDPKKYPYQIDSKDFETLEEAEAYAKKKASEEHEDVVIKQRISVVKFPLPDLKVESLV